MYSDAYYANITKLYNCFQSSLSWKIVFFYYLIKTTGQWHEER